MTMEHTLSIIKPDAVAKNVIGEIYTRFEKANLKIIKARIAENYKLGPGYVSVHDNAVYIGTSDDSLIVSQLQSEGSKITSAPDFARGHRDFENSILS